jgi:sRNA-binding regulator protein Hfq
MRLERQMRKKNRRLKVALAIFLFLGEVLNGKVYFKEFYLVESGILQEYGLLLF